MTAAPAARETDIIKHSSKLLGFFAGAVAAAVIAAVTIGTGGVGFFVMVGVGGALGYGAGALADMFMEDPGIKTGMIGPSDGLFIEINGLDAVAILDKAECYVPVVYSHGEKPIVEGSKTVLFKCCPAARKGDKLICDAAISTGSPNVLIGGAKVRIAGTRRTWVDEVLDVTSAYLTVAFLGTSLGSMAVGALTVGLTDTAQYVAGKLGANSLEQFAASTVSGFVLGPVLGPLSDMFDRNAAHNGMYRDYVRRKRAAGQTPLSRRAHARNNFVRAGVERRMAPRSKWVGRGQTIAPLVVDFARAYRDYQRDQRVPESRSPDLCGNESWLEPA
ncbi:PAAR domain-containing protein [Nannocystis sp. SCPEA4]|uniref:PAAR domain-containing protein n=1 Tax=Nannocystis sp. SCPEA4 TaxID=2996787 RepID=UPI00226E9474|nr:PAAR domain-containing protein [Nannocystis sp. SCPEA4]MCY1054728.1 PAAR domain-containing protein [Nannocystis sp. SCPEA4]